MRISRSVVGLLTAFLLLVSGTAIGSVQFGSTSATSSKADQFKVDASRPLGRTVRLAAGAFDPLAAGEPDLADALRATAPRHWIVQLEGPITVEKKASVQQAGARILGYVPDMAYVVAASPATATALRALPAVRWVGAYHPGYKLSPALRNFDGGDLRVYVHEDAQPAAVARTAAGIAGVKVVDVSPRIVTVSAPAAALHALARLEAVEWIEARPEQKLHNSNALWVSDTGERDKLGAAAPGRLDGTGQTAAVADTGINYVPDSNGNAQQAFSDCVGRACKRADYLQSTTGSTNEALGTVTPTGDHHRKMAGYFNLADDPLPRSTEPSWHGTHVSGSVAGDYPAHGVFGTRSRQSDGMAPAARLVFQDIEAGGTLGGIPGDQYQLFNQVYDLNGNGEYDPLEDARTHNNSYGSLVPMVDYDGSGMRTDDFVHEHPDMTIVFSASNDGPEIYTLSAGPQEAKNILVSCASANGRQPLVAPDAVASFSSHGPTFDGRIKPDVCTPGQIIVSPKGGTTDGDQYLQGTSMSGPVLVGLVTLVRQYFWDGFGPAGPVGYAGGTRDVANRRNPSAALVKAVTINSAQRMRGWYSGDRGGERSQDGMWPSGGQGWGRVQLDDALYFAGDDRNLYVEDRKNSPDKGLVTGKQSVRTIDVAPGEPLDVTLTWTDPSSAFVVGNPVLVNDLDLVVRAPDGTEYAGNDFTTQSPVLGTPGDPSADVGESVPGGEPDITNNVERFRLQDPIPGRYEVIVRGANVPDDPQGYALVASGRLATNNQNRIIFDAPEYAAGATGTAYLLGVGLRGDNVSGFQRIGRSIYKREFTASGATVEFTAGGVTASAPVDQKVPIARDVSVTSVSADLARVTWTTDEPTAGEVVIRSDEGEQVFSDVYVTDGLPGLETPQNETSGTYLDREVVSKRHEVNLTGLDPGGTYSYVVRGTDESGNAADLASGTFTSSDAIFAPAAPDMAMLLENDTTVGAPSTEQGWGTSTQFYTGSFVTTTGQFVTGLPTSTSKSVPAFMFRLPESVDPSRITGAAVQMTSAHDIVNAYVIDGESPKTNYSLDLLDSDIEDGWGDGTTYDQVVSAPADAHFVPEPTERRGANVPYTFHLACNELEGLQANLGEDAGGERRAAFRLEGLSEQPESLFSFEFGFGRRSRGPQLRPRLLLFLDGADPAKCTATDAPQINRVLVDHVTEDSAVVSWRTDVESDSTVYFRKKGTSEWTPVSAPVRTKQHFVRIGGLEPYGAYEFVVRSASCNGLAAVADNNGKAYALYNEAFRSPRISGVHARPTGEPGEATVGWRTDQAATSTVRYGRAPDQLDQEVSAPPDQLATAHGLTLIGLQPCTRYYFSVVSENRAGRRSSSPVAAFDTAASTPNQVATFTFDDGAAGWVAKPPEGNGNISEPGLGTNLGPNPTAWEVRPETSTGGSPAWRTVLKDSGAPGYSSNVNIRAVSPPIVVPAGPAQLEWKQWYSMEQGVPGLFTPLDRVITEVSTDDGVTWTEVYSPPAGGTNAEFPESGAVSVPLPAEFTGRTIRVAFHFVSDSNTEPPAGGWAVDDVNLLSFGCDELSGVVPGVPMAPSVAPQPGAGESSPEGNSDIGPVVPVAAGATQIGTLPNPGSTAPAALAAGTCRCGPITYQKPD